MLTHLQTVKGWAFVALSALLILVLSSRAVAREQAIGRSLKNSEAKFRATFSQTAMGMAHVGLDGRWLMVNDRLCDIVGYPAAELQAMTFQDITFPADRAADDRAVEALHGGADDCVFEKRYVRRDGLPVWVQLTANLVRDCQGKPAFYIVAVQEIEDRKRSEAALRAALKEKEVLLGEIHHRVRNNLQLVLSTLALKSAQINDTKARRTFDEALARVHAIALVHHHLYESRDFGRIDFAVYARDLCNSLMQVAAPEGIALDFRLDDFECDPSRVIPLGVILVELVTNSIKYAFPDGRPGTISVRLRRYPHDHVVLEVADDGVGLGQPVDSLDDTPAGTNCGLKLVRMLSGQLNGRLVHCPTPGGGTSLRIELGCADCPTAALCH
ncbi:MAG TPA: histidine kinase dimerization/phosphoacceptor domain -containing protein [Candidatus Omnitrophota bacterium]|nr:histidine kinase dimerization/phosphoacceptor domain -containing protein [Candidatus Omnitrophota bacterium]